MADNDHADIPWFPRNLTGRLQVMLRELGVDSLDDLATHDPLSLRRFEAPDLSRTGVYFLITGDQIVYIGQSQKSIGSRIGAHMGDGEKQFDSFSCMYVPAELCDAVEAWYIATLRPEYNKVIPSFVPGFSLLKSAEEKIDRVLSRQQSTAAKKAEREIRDGVKMVAASAALEAFYSICDMLLGDDDVWARIRPHSVSRSATTEDVRNATDYIFGIYETGKYEDWASSPENLFSAWRFTLANARSCSRTTARRSKEQPR